MERAVRLEHLGVADGRLGRRAAPDPEPDVAGDVLAAVERPSPVPRARPVDRQRGDDPDRRRAVRGSMPPTSNGTIATLAQPAASKPGSSQPGGARAGRSCAAVVEVGRSDLAGRRLPVRRRSTTTPRCRRRARSRAGRSARPARRSGTGRRPGSQPRRPRYQPSPRTAPMTFCPGRSRRRHVVRVGEEPVAVRRPARREQVRRDRLVR